MTWSKPADLLIQVERLWLRGELLRAAVGSDEPRWPLRLLVKLPTSADLSNRFDAVRDWVRQITATPYVRIEHRDWAHRVQGRQQVPQTFWIDTLNDALAMIGKAGDARRFQTLWDQTAATQPKLLPWLNKSPLQALALAEQWTQLLSVVAWVQAHPRPDVYLRQVDARGVDSKFIEAHRNTLGQWLDLALPAEAIDHHATGIAGFARRYGFRDKPVRIRLRLLDSELPQLPGCTGLSDISLDAESFASLALPVRQVFITENEINFLAFPPTPGAIAVFGAGYGWESLARADWLHCCTLHYWGDIDTHGFAILDSLRRHFPHANSFLMDRVTLMAHALQWGEEPVDKRHTSPLLRLTIEETALYEDLCSDRINSDTCVRLEQERVGYGWLCSALIKTTATV